MSSLGPAGSGELMAHIPTPYFDHATFHPSLSAVAPAMAAAKSGSAKASADGPARRVQAGDTLIEYRIRRSRQRKKTYQISVKSGEVVVAVPHRTTNRQAEEMVLQKAKWIISKLAVNESEPEAPQFLSGEKLPLYGRKLTLWVEGMAATNASVPEVCLDGRRLKVAVPVGMAEEVRQEQVGKAITAWYGDQTAEQIWQHVKQWWPKLGKGDGPTVQIRNQRRRWGSCSRDGILRFNWRLAMLEPALTEYVVVHELAHLTHMNHSANFWGLVRQHLPDVKERRQRLKQAGADLPQL